MITYRTDLFKKAGFKKPPKSLAQFQRQLVKVGKMQSHVKGFSPMYVGGEDWFTALGFVFDYGGSIAHKSHGKWVGTLASKKSLSGPQEVQGVLPRDAAEIVGEARRDQSLPVHRLLAGADGRELRPGLVHVLHRQEVRKGRRRSS